MATDERSASAEQAVARANQGFYDAHEARNLAALIECWEHTPRVICTHPGWPMLRGWDKVLASYEAILTGPVSNQFVLTDLSVQVHGDIAWVTLDENLIEAAATVATTNVFVRAGQRWVLVAHHASPVMASS